ncbi:MAG: hypothetical protein HOV66_18720 [Streptomycetaceae bacterium]|nr:hypothetical protein [Streptomycetaceae bacterium]
MNVALRVSYSPVPDVLGISPHGLFTAVGIGVGMFLLSRTARRGGLPAELLDRAVIVGVVAGIVGARLDYVLFHLGEFHSPAKVLEIWSGGLSLFGGLIAGIGAACLVLRRGGAHVLRVLDAAAPAIATAIGIGRIGDLLLTDHLGKPAGDGWFSIAYRIPVGADLAPGFGSLPAQPPGAGQSCTDSGSFYATCSYHLTPAYDLMGALLLAAALLLLARHGLRTGVASAVFAAWYGTQRLMTDFTRGIDERVIGGLSSTQLLSIVLIAAGLAGLAALRRTGLGFADPGRRPGAAPRALMPGREAAPVDESRAVPDVKSR